jgi:hypothetical protein
MKKWFLVMLIMLAAMVAVRPGSAQQPSAETQDQTSLEKVRSAEVAYLSEKMNLSPEEAEKFWPVYNQYTTEMRQLIQERKLALNAQAAASDAQADQSLRDEFAFRKKALDLQEKYKNEFLKVLPPRKVALFYQSREEFRNKVVDELNRRQNLGKSPRPNNAVHPRPLHGR